MSDDHYDSSSSYDEDEDQESEDKGQIKSTMSRSITIAGFKFVGDGDGSLSATKELKKMGMDKLLTMNYYDRPLKDLPEPESRRYDEEIFDPITKKPIPQVLKSLFVKEGRLTCAAALELISLGKDLLKIEPNLLNLQAPIIVCGDIHVFKKGGSLDEGAKYLFLGDYVDRGDFSTEVVLYLLALKICYPNQIYLLRGNHETRLMCEYMTFLIECYHKYDEEVYQAFVALFDCLPLAAVISGVGEKDIFCTHGGISPNIAKINRFTEPPTSGLFCDLLWSDPIAEFEEYEEEMYEDITLEQWKKITFIDNNSRHTSYFYGKAAVSNFLKRNNLSTMIRGHQVQSKGCMKTDELPYVITVFSAPNYCDSYYNQGAFINVTKDSLDTHKFSCVPHPYYLPDFTDCFTHSLPSILENAVVLLQQLVIKMKTETKDNSPREAARDEELKDKTDEILKKAEKLRKKQSRFEKVQLQDYHENMPLFLRALKSDREQESLPLPFRKKLMFSGNGEKGQSGRKAISSSSLL